MDQMRKLSEALRIVGLAGLLSVVGCVYNGMVHVSSSPVGENEVPVKTASGSSSAFYILIFGPFGDASVNAAVEDALSKGTADTIMNVFVDRSATVFPVSFLPLVTIISTDVFGTLIRYGNEEFEHHDSEGVANKKYERLRNAQEQKALEEQQAAQLQRDRAIVAMPVGAKILVEFMNGTQHEFILQKAIVRFDKVAGLRVRREESSSSFEIPIEKIKRVSVLESPAPVSE